MKRKFQFFDISEFPNDSKFEMPRVNKKKLGLIKEECNGDTMIEFAGLQRQVYSFLVEGKYPTKNLNGIKKTCTQKKNKL